MTALGVTDRFTGGTGSLDVDGSRDEPARLDVDAAAIGLDAAGPATSPEEKVG